MAGRHPQNVPAVAADRELGAVHRQLPAAGGAGAPGREGRGLLGVQRRRRWQGERPQDGRAIKLPLRRENVSVIHQ
uniref:Uncharacterized protein n=1 Tax=Aegilops tauschii subsp. strangulata TaxID=200361 RepID=A0A453AB77_AEGTS